jgi:hypothetical protein
MDSFVVPLISSLIEGRWEIRPTKDKTDEYHPSFMIVYMNHSYPVSELNIALIRAFSYCSKS